MLNESAKMKCIVVMVISLVHVGICHLNCRGEEPRIRNCDKVCDENNNCKIRAALLLPKNTSYDVCLPAVSMNMCLYINMLITHFVFLFNKCSTRKHMLLLFSGLIMKWSLIDLLSHYY